MLDAGRLTEIVALYSPTAAAPNSYGTRADSFSLVTNVWAEVLGAGGTKRRRGDQPQSEYSHVVTIRWRSDVRSSWQLIWDDAGTNRTLRVVSAVDEEGLRESLVLKCIEVKAE